VAICKRSRTVPEACEAIRAELKRPADASNLRALFAAHGKPAPKELVRGRPALDIDAARSAAESRATAADVRQLQARLIEAERLNDYYTKLPAIAEIKIDRSRAKSGKRAATPVTMASDWHVGEVVSEEETLGKNHYDLKEAERRAGNFWDNVFWLRKDAQRHSTCEDHVLNINGDIISGNIHPELEETNAVGLADQVSTAAGMLMPGIRELSKQCRRVLVPCTHGNHARVNTKSRVKTGWANSLETLLYRQLKQRCEDLGLSNVEFRIPRAENLQIDVMGYRLQMQHGTQFRSQGGVGGVLVPLTRAAVRMQASVFAHLYLFGHFHWACFFEPVIINGSLIGDSAYSRAHGMTYREPEQVNFLIDARRGLRSFNQVSVT
jgi:hypothetical protein